MIWKISLFLLVWALPAAAVECQDRTFEATSFTVCTVDNTKSALRLFLRHPSGTPYGHFGALPGDVRFAMNAGMYHSDRSPVGYYLEDGQREMSIVSNAGPGNFGMLPNGIYCIRDGRADVIETHDFIQNAPSCDHATQSGPMLVVNGYLHPRFISGSSFKNIRNGVGTTMDGTVSYFAISNEPVNFDTFARLFRDDLNVDQALYFDGRVSRLYAPGIGRNDFGPRMGPIIAVMD